MGANNEFQPMHLLHVMQRYWPAIGGAERFWQELSERAAAEGHCVEVYTTNVQDVELFWEAGRAAIATPAETHNGVEIHRFPVRHLYPKPIGYRAIRRVLTKASDWHAPLPVLRTLAESAPLCPELGRALHNRRAPVDLIAGVNIVYEGLLFPALDLAKSAHVPFVFCPFTHLGEAGNRTVGRYYTMRHQVWLAAQSDAIFVGTGGEARFFESQGISPEKLVRIGSGVSPEKLLGGQGQRARHRYGLSSPLILFLGTVSTDKGARQSVEAMAELIQHKSDAHLVLAGPPLDEFLQFFRSQPAAVRERCHLIGAVAPEDTPDLLDACDMLVLPSRADSFGIVFLEAWLYAKPVIGARAGAIPEVIDHERDGLLVPYGDAHALAEAISRLLAHPDLATALGAHGKAKVYERYIWDRVYSRVSQVYRRLGNRESIADLSWAQTR